MALSRSQKQDLIQLYENGLALAPHAFLVSYQGISVPQDTELRRRIRTSGGEYLVVKNTLALRAIEGKALEALKEQFRGPIAVAYIHDDPVALAKTLTDFVKEVPKIEFRGGVVEGRAIGADQVQDIARLPSREELLAKLLFLLQSPITRLARGLAAIPQQMVVALDQIAKQKAEQG